MTSSWNDDTMIGTLGSLPISSDAVTKIDARFEASLHLRTIPRTTQGSDIVLPSQPLPIPQDIFSLPSLGSLPSVESSSSLESFSLSENAASRRLRQEVRGLSTVRWGWKINASLATIAGAVERRAVDEHSVRRSPLAIPLPRPRKLRPQVPLALTLLYRIRARRFR
ncbi:hypothetical protein NMY22_g6809 [Coprinellus aureogranulatus]|nr:hypothetical protein NMY22_g6809 [Coprinellus aureogranulatus]